MKHDFRARRPIRLPVVLTRQEIATLLSYLKGIPWLVASLCYGAGLRLTECLRLRIKDLDFIRRAISVRNGKGHGYDIRTIQELLGHKDVSTTMIYTHAIRRGAQAVISPLDRLFESPNCHL